GGGGGRGYRRRGLLQGERWGDDLVARIGEQDRRLGIGREHRFRFSLECLCVLGGSLSLDQCAVGIAAVATSATAAAPPALARLLPALATSLACGFSSGGQFLVFVFLALFGAGHVRRGGAGFVLMRLSGG